MAINITIVLFPSLYLTTCATLRFIVLCYVFNIYLLLTLHTRNFGDYCVMRYCMVLLTMLLHVTTTLCLQG